MVIPRQNPLLVLRRKVPPSTIKTPLPTGGCLIFAIMAQKKLQRFAAIKTFENVLEYPEGMAGQWHGHFKNDHPVTLELACGKGEYAVGLGQLFPDQNFIGVDVKGNRIWVGADYSLKHRLGNVAFLRTQIHQIDRYFAPGEVDEIWITFPDPQVRISAAKRRLTHPRYLELYRKILKTDGRIHLKTDSPDLYNFTKTVIGLCGLQLLDDRDDLYHSPGVTPSLQIKTHYEGLDIAGSQRIFYLCFSLPGELPDRTADLEKLLKNSPYAQQ